jgi:tol-pal system protein YbgF
MRFANSASLLTLFATLAVLPSTSSAAPRPSVPVGGAPVILAQAGDPRVTALEEQIRQLNGRIEELNFQILQMQDQMNKMQQDNEFRFQELEGGKKQGAAPADGTQKKSEAAEPAVQDQAAAPADAAPASGEESATTAAEAPAEDSVERGAPPSILGTVTFDAKGNPSGATIENAPPPDAEASGQAETAAPDGETVASLPRSDNPDELYRNSYQFVLSGDYRTAEVGFRDYVERFPDDARVPDARYWLGESLFGQERYKEAAEVFLAASKAHPKAKKAPDMLLKLGVSLAALNQRDVACATFAEIGKRYPGASDALKGRVVQEQALAGC